MLLPEYRDLLNRALTFPAVEDDPEHDPVLFLRPAGRDERAYYRHDVRQMLTELRELWERGTAKDQESFVRYVSNIASGRLAVR